MDFSDLDTSLKVTLQNVTLYSNWLYNNRIEIQQASNRSNYITSRIGFVESNKGAIISFLKKTGLVTSTLEVSPLALLVAKEELTYQEICLIHLSKESLFIQGIPKVNLITLLSSFIRENEEDSYDLNKIRNLNLTFQEIDGNKNSNGRTDYILTLLEGTNLFIRQGRAEDGIIALNEKAKPIIDYFAERPIANCDYTLNSANRFDYFCSLEDGVFRIISNELPKEWLELFPHLTLDNIQKIKNTLIPAHMNTSNKSSQIIYYGAPGTGKSYCIKELTKGAEADKRVFRTTFHPDSDYSTFVGCYKPSMESKERLYDKNELISKLSVIKNTGVTYPCHKFAAKYWESLKQLTRDAKKDILSACEFPETMVVEIDKGIVIGEELSHSVDQKQIVYQFVPQAFTNAYVKAYQTTEPVYLVIEEINRGNCAQIFGDLFQLLDRDDAGYSKYPIIADTDLGNHIRERLQSVHIEGIDEVILEGQELVLPSNLYILASMNTSDQSLFPIDSAFKRRWDWKYIPIEDADKGYTIKVNGHEYDWWTFLEAINKEVFELTNSEDKQMGYFFVKRPDGVIDAETLVNKVYFYLWNDVFKDYDLEGQKAFKNEENKAIAFKDFFIGGLNEKLAEQVILNLGLTYTDHPEL